MPGSLRSKAKSIHTPQFDKMVEAIKAKQQAKQQGLRGNKVNPYAVAMAKLGRNKAIKKSHWKEIGLGAKGH